MIEFSSCLDGLKLSFLNREYEEFNNEKINPHEYGYATLKDLLLACPDACRLKRDPTGDLYDFTVVGVADKLTAHVQDLLSKASKKKKKKKQLFNTCTIFRTAVVGTSKIGKITGLGAVPFDLRKKPQVTEAGPAVYGDYVASILKTRPFGMYANELEIQYKKKFRDLPNPIPKNVAKK